MGLREIVELSRRYGGDERFVLAGGGNTSYKDEQHLYVKASGFPLATIGENGFVRMVRAKLNGIWGRSYPTEPAAREAMALADLMAARDAGEESKRPSVETLLHEAIPRAYVVHTHPGLVNGITCSRDGEKAAREILGPGVLWVPLVNPGYVLARTVKDAMEDFRRKTGGLPEMILLQNHGVFVFDDDPEGIRRTYDRIFSEIDRRLQRRPDHTAVPIDAGEAARVAGAVRDALTRAGAPEPPCVRFLADRGILRVLESREAFEPVSSAFSPDHIVYCGHAPLYILREAAFADGPAASVGAYAEEHGLRPKVVAVQGLGVFGCGVGEKAALSALELFRDAVGISVYAGSFGGHRFMPAEQVDFIRNWEVEHYRTTVSTVAKG